ncbi:ribbon-helix-helix domain-containing protein [Haloimpatiens sp. FM7315]|uniref:ribbon-helix-helix domain-containing protein n=1 Tax=Haloimpatiens sp. FM7315 TaxID=3298609 RepID=UPI0035A3B4BA
MIKKENTRINVTISKKIHEMLVKEAEYEDRSVSNLVLQIIKKHYNIKNDD